ncbi:MAG TPA: hypothetical protein VGS22_14995 [Thermoanaerobaculia bacterium]|jgi:hypothetical protein|nr:hypothetical protein [Thermoanaerobaculia bacterium]
MASMSRISTSWIWIALFLAAFGASTAGAQCPSAAPPAGCQPITAHPVPPIVPGGGAANPPDVVISDCRTVAPGTYSYGYVNVVKGGTLYFADQAGGTNLYAKSILVQQGGSIRAGAWCQPFGTGGGKLTIGLWGDDPTNQATVPSSAGIVCKDAAGQPADCYASGPQSPEGKYCTGGNISDPCSSPTGSANALFEGYKHPWQKSAPSLDLHFDGNTFGFKTFAVSYGGSVELFGKKGVADAFRTDPEGEKGRPRMCAIPGPAQQFNPQAWANGSGASWARLNASVGAGAGQLTLDRSVDWGKDDQIVLTTTDWHPSHSELLKLASGGSPQLTLDGKTSQAHQGQIFKIDPNQLSHDPGNANKSVDVRAAVGLLSRSITIRSMGAAFDAGRGVPADFPPASQCATNKPECYFGGHILVRQGFGRFQLQGVELYQLGQGGRMGHYPVHFHLDKDTSYTNAFVKDSSIWDSNTRFVVLHGTHGVEIARNVGYLSMGHAFYLEDGSEIGNAFCYNLGVSARASLTEYFAAQEPNSPTRRFVPPILNEVGVNHSVDPNAPLKRSDPECRGKRPEEPCLGPRTLYDRPTIGSDATTPAMFWIMNADNDFVGNLAVGVHGVGTCYWPLHSSVSGPSRSLSWNPDTESYANFNNVTRVAPLRRFRGNGCSTAAYAIMMERGAGFPDASRLPDEAGLTPVGNPYGKPDTATNPRPSHDRFSIHDDLLPRLTANFQATRKGSGNCVPGMRAGDANACATTVIDHFTTSFNWAEVNVGSIWLRPFHYLFSNSAVTDQLYGGLGFVSGGSPEQALPGQLAIAMDSLFVGSTAAAGAKDASSLGPDVSAATKCSGSFCSFARDGVPYFIGSFQPKRLITIYDGPFFADGNLFLVDEPKGSPPASSVYLRTTQPWENNRMRVVDAGIGWKQPNGFYYPPVFGFRNSGFRLGSARHNVVDQYAQYAYGNGTASPRVESILGDASFTPIDTQTILNDLDGTLDGVKVRDSSVARSSGLSNNHFYDTPFTVPQCNSFGTVTLPHELASTFIAKLNQLPAAGGQAATETGWGTAGAKPAVAVYRQFRLSNSDPAETCAGASAQICGPTGQTCRRGTFFMGSSIGQGIGLTVRGGKFYVDTASGQQTGKCLGATNAGFQMAQFEKGKTYAIYNLFANSETKTTYQVYVGPNFDLANGFSWIRVFPHETAAPSYVVRKGTGPAPAAMDFKDGVLTITIDQSRIAESFAYDAKDPIRCQPRDLCQPGPGGCTPVASLPPGYEGLKPLVDRVCRDWVNPANAEVTAGKDKGLFLAECPAGGCLGFAFTLPGNFTPRPYAEVGQKLSECYPKDATWNRPMVAADRQNCPVPPSGGSFCQ